MTDWTDIKFPNGAQCLIPNSGECLVTIKENGIYMVNGGPPQILRAGDQLRVSKIQLVDSAPKDRTPHTG